MTRPVKTVLQIVSWAACAATVVPAFLFLAGSMQLDTVKQMMMITTVIWFLTASFWMGKEDSANNPE